MSHQTRELLFQAVDSAVESDDAIFCALAFTSFFELVAAAVACDTAGKCTGYNGFAVAVGCISLVVAVGFTVVHRLGEGMEAKVQFTKPYVGIGLMLWWAVSAGIMTFKAPFVAVGNGYFATWASFALSIALYRRASLHLVPKPFGGTSDVPIPFMNRNPAADGSGDSAEPMNPASGAMGPPMNPGPDPRFTLQQEPYAGLGGPGGGAPPPQGGATTVGLTAMP